MATGDIRNGVLCIILVKNLYKILMLNLVYTLEDRYSLLLTLLYVWMYHITILIKANGINLILVVM